MLPKQPNTSLLDHFACVLLYAVTNYNWSHLLLLVYSRTFPTCPKPLLLWGFSFFFQFVLFLSVMVLHLQTQELNGICVCFTMILFRLVYYVYPEF